MRSLAGVATIRDGQVWVGSEVWIPAVQPRKILRRDGGRKGRKMNAFPQILPEKPLSSAESGGRLDALRGTHTQMLCPPPEPAVVFFMLYQSGAALLPGVAGWVLDGGTSRVHFHVSAALNAVASFQRTLYFCKDDLFLNGGKQ